MNRARISQKDEGLKRQRELTRIGRSRLRERKKVLSGFEAWEKILKQKEKILKVLGGTEEDWQDWRWQLKNRITTPEVLRKILPLSDQVLWELEEVSKVYRFAISPYYLSLIDPDDPDCGIKKQSIPSILEVLDDTGELDPMNEAGTSPVAAVTRRYPDRLIINVTNMCGMYCRHCQRRRNIGEVDRKTPREQIKEALLYIREHKEIRDVLITGGDALLLSDLELDWILKELSEIPHVEIKRIGTRVPVTLPQRVTDNLVKILKKYPPIYINTQFNHPREVTPEAKKAVDKLIEAGVVLGNQAVLLKGVNDNPVIMEKLNHELLKIRVRPYYIFQAKRVRGTMHFVPKIEDGLRIMESLRGYTSGLAVPYYIVNAPGGFGKIPLLPQYLIELSEEEAVLRNWEGRIIRYPNN
ncbi:glutamate 2,3-aminomutase [Carboxydothermus hydrogenoformans]|uniref:Putative L-lysine 2,3-aminomutase n=1 Tax=Carboxydothermus hydrogenoformans (strain ATCC BAA-161 / DSM 6008 / Z-2901) TaxID=246194 RepID=Q3A9B1_CARHZ|nr:glutamate 2,3-aminomutase [Carboxydothermus hydrogenoformans]ABB16099.1 putative L-lysine 2,3-aminomutase [Carboxydothermus hydrogenoformans Z-2901]